MENVARMVIYGDMRNPYNVVAAKPEGRRQLRIPSGNMRKVWWWSV